MCWIWTCLDRLTLPRPLSLNQVGTGQSLLITSKHNYKFDGVSPPPVRTFNMLEVILSPTICVETYSYLYFIYCKFIEIQPNFVTIHGIDFYQNMHVYAPNVYPFLVYMSNSKWSFGSQLFTHTCIFHIHMPLWEDGGSPPPFHWKWFLLTTNLTSWRSTSAHEITFKSKDYDCYS